MTNQENNPSIGLRPPADQSGYRLPDLESWMSEIEEFVSEISSDLNQIAESLGDRSVTLPAHSLNLQTASKTISSELTAREQSKREKQTDRPSTDPLSGNDRLGSLKRRLANLKSESRPEALTDSPGDRHG